MRTRAYIVNRHNGTITILINTNHLHFRFNIYISDLISVIPTDRANRVFYKYRSVALPPHMRRSRPCDHSDQEVFFLGLHFEGAFDTGRGGETFLIALEDLRRARIRAWTRFVSAQRSSNSLMLCWACVRFSGHSQVSSL